MMVVIILALIYVFVNAFLVRWILRWTAACHKFFHKNTFRISFICVYTFVALSPLLAFLFPSPLWLRRVLKQINNYWLGWLLYLILAVVVVELLLFLVRKLRRKDFEEMERVRRVQGAIALTLICVVCIYGMVHARSLHVTEFTVTSDKQGEDMTIALLADLHLGYSTDADYIEKTVNAVNDMNPDVVLIAGDIFDNEFDAVPQQTRLIELFAGLKSRYGTYACYGNHDLDENLLAGFTWNPIGADKDDPRMEEFLQKANITLLLDDTVELSDDVYLIGRKDSSRTRKLGDTRLSPVALTKTLDERKTIIMLDHQPRQLEEMSDCGVDLDLSGHTHDGQVFPYNLAMRLAWENPCGALKIGNMTSIVTSGVGIWGPDMRTGTDSEVVCIHLDRAG